MCNSNRWWFVHFCQSYIYPSWKIGFSPVFWWFSKIVFLLVFSWFSNYEHFQDSIMSIPVPKYFYVLLNCPKYYIFIRYMHNWILKMLIVWKPGKDWQKPTTARKPAKKTIFPKSFKTFSESDPGVFTEPLYNIKRW